MRLLIETPALLAEGERLAEQHRLELDKRNYFDWRRLSVEEPHLLLLENGLSLVVPGRQRMRPLLISLSDKTIQSRLARAGEKSEAVARAVGLKSRGTLRVVDATAGLGRDAMVLAALGCEVTLFERNPVLALLMADAMRRALSSPDSRAVQAVQRMRLVVADARYQLASLVRPAGATLVIMLDPMFDEGRGSAASKREIRYLQCLGLADRDGSELLEVALRCPSATRVVVKRPLKGENLGAKPPHHVIRGSSTRFDVYLPHH